MRYNRKGVSMLVMSSPLAFGEEIFQNGTVRRVPDDK